MQNNFSKCREWVPRGTSQHKWRWLTTLLLILTLGIGQMWAASESVPKTKDNWTGTSCKLTHAECANGSTSAQKDGDASSVTYIKFRTNKNGNTMTFEVNEGYKVTGFSMRGFANDDDNAVELASVKYDSADPIAVNQSFPNKSAGTTYTYSNTTNEASSAIVLSFGTNAGTQIMAVITITYEEVGEDTEAPTLSSSVPANSATDVAVEGTIVLTFSEALASVDASKFSLDGATIGTVAKDGTDSKKVNVPYSGAANEATVTLSVAAEAVTDAAGNKSAALSNIVFTTVAASGGGEDPEPTCPTEGQLYSAVTTATGNIAIATTTGLELNTSTHKTTVSGGKMYVISKQSSAKNLITNGAFCQTNNDTYFKVELDCALEEGDVISINVGKDGSNDRGVWVSTATSRPSSAPACALTAKSSSLTPKTYVVTSTDEYVGKKVFYIYRATGNSTYFNNVVITRPYSVLYDNLKEAIHTMPAKAVEFTLQELTNATFNHTGWTADKLVKVGGADKAAGTTLGKTDVVTLTDNTAFTAVWEAKVTKHTVTYYDGEAIEANKLGSELINEGSNPTGAGLAPKKQGFTFGGWSLTNGGAAISAYTDVTVNEDKNLFAVWTAVDCPTKGTVFSFVMNNDAKPSGDVKADAKGSLVIDEYLTISGSGSVIIGNTTNNNNQYAKVTSTPNVNLSGATGYLRLAMDCQLAAGDVITIAKNNTQIYISDEVGTSGPTGNKYTTANNSENTIVVGANETTAEWVGSRDLYFWYKGGGVNITAISVNRPYTVSFNMNGQSATAIADQKIVAGGKVSEPTAPSVTGQEFGGWFKVAACTAGNEWDFATDVVNDDVELFAKWTALPKMTLVANGSGEEDEVSYPTVGSSVAVPACPFTYSGYIFAGWTYSPSVTVEDGSFTMPNQDLTLTAQWVDASSVARIGSNYYATLADALDHAADGEIVLLQDINVEAQVEIADGVSATIDLAGHKIEYTSATTLPSGVILVHNGASLTINDSSDPNAGSIVSGDKAYAAVALTKLGDDPSTPATLVVNGGALTGYYYGITGNGSRNNTVITINGGTITGTVGIAIYHPQVGTLTVNNGSLTGEDAAIEMRAGTLVINDGTFTATATEFSCNPNGSGSTTSGAAIAIAQHTTKKDIEVTINGGTFNGVKALNESNPQVNDPAPQVTMSVTGGNFTGGVSTADVNNFVSGGSFSTPVAESQCATGYVPETKPNGKYGVIVPAQSIDFMAIIDAKGTGDEGKAELDGQLASKHYDIDGTLNNDRLEAGGFKVKKTGLTISFSVEKEKVVEITTGHISGASIKVDDAAAVAMEGDKKHTYYSDDAQAFLITMTATGNAYNIFKSINIRAPYVVTFDGNGGTPAVASLNGTPSVTLPSASKGTDSFVGWFDGETKIGEAGESYTPIANITLVAHWEAVSTDARLSAIEFSAVGTLSPAFDPDVVNYTYTMPYGTADVPTITGATAANAKAQEPVIDAQAAAWGETAHVHGVAQSGAIKDYYVQMLRAPKDGICIIKSTPTSGTEADVDGIYQGSAYFKGKAANKKLNSTYDYVAVELADGYTFQAGDKVVLNQAADLGDASDITKFYVFTEVPADGKTYVTVDNAAPVKGDNWFDMPADLVGASALYIGRIDAKCNPTVGYLAVYRLLPPVLNKVTVAGVEGKPNALKEVVFEVAASTSQSQLEAIAFDWISNNDAWTADPANAPVAANAWEFGVANTVTFTDKDGDQSVYTITVNKAIPATNVELATLTVDGNAITVVPGQDVYEYEYPYGTAETPAPVVAATTDDANATLGAISQATTKNGTATFTVTAEDGITSRDYTVKISVSRIPAVAIYDGSTMTNITTKTGSDPTGLSWSMGSNVAASGDNIAGTWQGKNYTHAVKGFKANANENNIVSFVVPENYMAKVRLVGSTNSSGSERKMFIAKEATNDASKAIENYVITSSTYDAQGFVTDFMLPGTYYLGSTDSYRLFEFSVQLYPIDYSRDVTEGKYGTICLPNGGVMVGASIYTLAYYGETSKKIFFDEVVDGTMEAGKPYLFLPNEGIDRIGVFYTDAANEPNKTVNGFVGYIGASEDPNDALQVPAGEGNYIVQNNQYREILTGAKAYILSHRAYIHFAGINTSEPAKAPGARRIGISGAPQVTTGVDGLNVGDQPVKLIIDGQMYILRGDKMYDATGRLVK